MTTGRKKSVFEHSEASQDGLLSLVIHSKAAWDKQWDAHRSNSKLVDRSLY
jgi:hypothetical protein